ncbi:MAG: DNA methyltransferase [Hyphomicrobiaceae bacterium]|nr:DNA methyltransferase [Hyphomicrobiaceae bacterium]
MNMGNGSGRRQRLELTWIGKDERPRLEPRILLPVAEQSYARGKPGDGGIHDNILIQGDNLLALKSLEQQFAGKVKCVYIDPPYNTGSAFEQYDDGLEHSIWLSLMRDRLELLHRLLSDDGAIWVSIDDNEGHYLKVMMDEVFGRRNFVATVIWQKIHARNNTAVHFSADHDFKLVYSKNIDSWKRNKVSRTAESDAEFWNPDNDPRGLWRRSDLTAAKPYSDGHYEVTGPHGDVFSPRANRYWSLSRASFKALQDDNRLWWGRSGRTFPFRKRFQSELGDLVPTTIWSNEEVGDNRAAKQESAELFGRDAIFATPKPERLLERIIAISTDPGDIVLDSFAGSGTTGAVAHKMGRRWIMVELGDHAHTHIVPRLKKVIDRQDLGGVTEATGWKGGGGFRTYRLAPSLIETDQFGQKIISKQYNASMLAEAMCKHMGFTYDPSQDQALYWQQGHSSERDFIFVTTQSLTHDTLKSLSLEVGEDRTLLVCCKAFRARLSDFPNLTVKKIPQAVLDNCEWGRDDYSLNIAKPPEGEADATDDGSDDDGNGGEATPRRRGRATRSAEPAAEAEAAPVKKAPLKMDGTTRVPKVSRSPAPLAAKTAVTTKKASKAPRKSAKSEKSKGSRKTKSAPRAATPKAKLRRAVDNRQGRLL